MRMDATVIATLSRAPPDCSSNWLVVVPIRSALRIKWIICVEISGPKMSRKEAPSKLPAETFAVDSSRNFSNRTKAGFA